MLNYLIGGIASLIVAAFALFWKPVWAKEMTKKSWAWTCVSAFVVGTVIGGLSNNPYTAASFGILGAVSTVTIVTDFLFMKIPKTVQRVGMVSAACILILRGCFEGMSNGMINALLGALIGCGLSLMFFLLALISPKFRNHSGGGDIRMMMVLGLTTPINPIVWSFIGSVVIAIAWVIISKKRKLPYGPALSGSAIIAAAVAGIMGVA